MSRSASRRFIDRASQRVNPMLVEGQRALSDRCDAGRRQTTAQIFPRSTLAKISSSITAANLSMSRPISFDFARHFSTAFS